MSNAISSLYVEFSASTKKFTDSMADITRSVKEVDKVLKPIKAVAADVGRSLTAAVSVPVLGLATAAVSSALKIDDAMDDIRASTGATGAAFEKLGNDFRTVLSDVPNSIGDVGKAIGELNKRTGLSGKPLQELSTQLLNVARMTKTEIGEAVAASTRVFGDWSVVTDKQASTLDYLFRVSQKTGVGFDALERSVVQFGAPLRQMGFSLETSAALLGKFEKEGVNAELVMSSLRIALTRLAQAGVTDASQGLQEITKQIAAAGTASQANVLAVKVFGAKAGPDMAAAIREGRFAVADLVKELKASPESINSAAAATRSLGEKMNELKNKAALALEPVGVKLTEALERLIPAAQRALGFVSSLADGFSRLGPGAQDAIIATVGITAVLGPAITIITKISSTVVTLISLIAKLGFSWAALTSAFEAAKLLGAVKTFGDLSAAVSLIAGTSALATAGFVALAAAVGYVAGTFANWVIKVTGLQGSLDSLVRTAANFIGLTGDWGTGQANINDATQRTSATTKALVAELAKRNIVVDQSRVGDAAYLASLNKQVQSQTTAAQTAGEHAAALTKAGAAAGATGKDVAALNKLLADDSTKKASEAIKTLVDSIIKESGETQTLVAAIKQLESRHVSSTDIRNKLGKQISDNVLGLQLEGKVVPDVLQKYADLTKQHEVYSKVLTDFTAKSREALTPFADLEVQLAILNGQFSRSAIIGVYADEIVSLADKQIAAGGTLDDFAKGLYDQAKAFLAVRDASKEFNDSVASTTELLRLSRKLSVLPIEAPTIPPLVVDPTIKTNLDDITERVRNASNAIDNMHRMPAEVAASIVQMQRAGRTNAEIIAVMGDEITKATETARKFNIPLDENVKAIFRQAEAAQRSVKIAQDFKQAWTVAIGNIASNFADSVADMIFSGKKLSLQLKSIFTDLGKSLVKILVTDAFTQIGKGLTGLLSNLAGGSKGLSGLISGLGGKIGLGALTGGAGSAAGMIGGTSAAGFVGPVAPGAAGLSSIGALATNPITIAAAGALAAGLAIKHFVGQGRRTANEFVQGAENPFSRNLSNVVDSFANAQKAGTLTLESAQQSRDALSSLWQNFIDSSNEFAAQGKNQAKVVEQSQANLARLFGPNLANVFGSFDTAIADIKKKADAPAGSTDAATAAKAGSGIPQTGLAQSASRIFADAVTRFDESVKAQPPITVQFDSQYAPTFTFYGVPESLQQQIKDQIEPQILSDLENNSRGVLERLQNILSKTGLAFQQ